ncbi:hypothetical protein J2X01_003760 [Arthrobacter ginsengisoli]|uniref:ABC transporter permease n=1 Tax=Arthrobacter ginsengisoli TaxID=1356565 RepID=A0ABU1UH34_9MICC|nr:hypothetical protein [Arthrobacter ginsengisoli]MDR7084450.1 hypothetical protein [Arthrobacter ginsengisoli]
MGEPRVIAILQWTTLVVCALIAIARIPSALRGENRSLFGVFVLSTVAILLSIDVSYRATDAWLGSENYTNLLLRFVVYGAVLLSGYRIAKAFDARKSIRLIAGPVGLGVLSVIGIATVVLFLLADTEGSVTGLTTLPARSRENAVLIEGYAAVGRLYPSFVAACILPATCLAIGQRLPRAIRIGALLLTIAFAGMAFGTFYPLIPSEAGFVKPAVNYASVLCLALGLAFVWVSRLMARRTANLR